MEQNKKEILLKQGKKIEKVLITIEVNFDYENEILDAPIFCAR